MKYLLISFTLMWLPFNASFGQNNKEMQTYCNTRFQFCIQYPEAFNGQGESFNGDGQIFKSLDRNIEIRAWGQLVVDEADGNLEADYKLTTASLRVTYSLQKKEYYIVSGTDTNGNIIYQKTGIKKIKDTDDAAESYEVFQSVRIVYPLSLKEEYKRYCEYIATCSFD